MYDICSTEVQPCISLDLKPCLLLVLLPHCQHDMETDCSDLWTSGRIDSGLLRPTVCTAYDFASSVGAGKFCSKFTSTIRNQNPSYKWSANFLYRLGWMLRVPVEKRRFSVSETWTFFHSLKDGCCIWHACCHRHSRWIQNHQPLDTRSNKEYRFGWSQVNPLKHNHTMQQS